MTPWSDIKPTILDLSCVSSKNLKFRYRDFGCYLELEVMKKNNLPIAWLATTLDVSEGYAKMVLSNKVKISKDMAQGLGNYFRTNSDYWIQLQEKLNQTNVI